MPSGETEKFVMRAQHDCVHSNLYTSARHLLIMGTDFDSRQVRLCKIGDLKLIGLSQF
jgi:hypothetical protein